MSILFLDAGISANNAVICAIMAIGYPIAIAIWTVKERKSSNLAHAFRLDVGGISSMGDSTMFILCLILCIGGCVFCPYWIKTARDSRDKTWGILSLIVCAFLVVVSSWGIIADNNLLWYGQHKENAHIEMNINTSNVEKTSFIYLIEQFGPDTSVDDVINIMGTNYDVSTIDGYEMKYTTSKYTLDGSASTFISFKFNKRKTEILSIKWSYQSPSQEMFTETLRYLENNAFGKATTSSVNKADWKGLCLEDTNYFLLLIREF